MCCHSVGSAQDAHFALPKCSNNELPAHQAKAAMNDWVVMIVHPGKFARVGNASEHNLTRASAGVWLVPTYFHRLPV